jgi:hypothetical protein
MDGAESGGRGGGGGRGEWLGGWEAGRLGGWEAGRQETRGKSQEGGGRRGGRREGHLPAHLSISPFVLAFCKKEPGMQLLHSLSPFLVQVTGVAQLGIREHTILIRV